MTLNQIADSVADGLNRSLDIAFKERIKFSIKYWRARLIKQEIDKSNYNDLFFHSVVIPLSKVDITDNCYISSECPVLRSIDKIPTPIRNRGVKSFAFVGAVNGKVRFESTTIESLPIKLSSKYRSKTIFYDYRNDYLYIYNNTKLEYAMIRGVFADLDSLVNFQCNNGVCYTDNDNFPMPMDMIPFLINGLLTNELKLVGKEDKEVDINTESNDAD